jgi:hypothetical protein
MQMTIPGPITTPMRRIPWSARAASGHAAVAPPNGVMNSRRLMGLTPKAKDHGPV